MNRPETIHYVSHGQFSIARFSGGCTVNGAVAFHLIERHASGWEDTARMMEDWRKANSEAGDKQDQRTHRALLCQCLSVIDTLDGEDSTESEMLADLKDDIKQAIGLKPVVPGSLL